MTHIRSRWRRLTCQTLALAMVLMGVTVVATPQAHAAADAVVSGTVIDSVTQQPLSSATITDSTSGRSATTATQGTYTLQLPAGDHVLTATLAGYVPSSTPKLTLTAGQTLSTQGFTLAQYASASGVVTEKGTTTGSAAVVVKFFDSATESPNPDVVATTGPDGSWSIAHVAPGTYKVLFDAAAEGFVNQWYDKASSRVAATVVTLKAGEKRDIAGALPRETVASASTTVTSPTAAPATVSAQSVGSISGHVTIDPGGVPAGNALVRAQAVNGAAWSLTTDAMGAYSLAGLPAGYFQVSAQSDGSPGLVGYLGGAVSYRLATYVQLADGATLTDQNIHLQQTATLSGTVTNRGVPAGGVQVGLTGMGLVAGAISEPNGTFQIRGISPGDYRLWAAFGDQLAWWNSASDVAASTAITVGAADNLTGYSIAVIPQFFLSGDVRSAGGAVVTTGRIAVTDGINTWFAYVNQGSYGLDLAGGTYELGYQNQDGTVDWSPGSFSPDLVTIATNTVKDVTIPPDRTIMLTVRGTDGSVPSALVVYAYDAGRNNFFRGATSSNGTLSLDLPQGAFRLELSAPDYRPWSTQIMVTSSISIPVTLDLGGKIAGAVAGAPAMVTAINTTTGERFSIDAPAGSYAFGGVSVGEYVVSAAPLNQWSSPCGWAAWLGGTNYSNARRLQVGNGTSLHALDFTVGCEPNWTPGGDLLGEVALPPSAPTGAVGAVVVYATNTVGSISLVPYFDSTFELLSMTPGTYEIAAYQSPLGLEAHATVTIAAGIATILTLNMTPRGRVLGRVLGPLNEPVRASISNGETDVRSDSQGDFALGGISYGTHTLTVVPEAPYALTFVDVTVSSGTDTIVTIRTTLASGLEGRLTSTAGRVAISVTDASGRVLGSDYFTYSFSFDGLPPGPVRVCFSGSEIVPECWRDAPDRASATPIMLPAGGRVSGVIPTLAPAAADARLTAVSGRVTFAGSPLAGVSVSTQVGSDRVATTTVSDGTYSLEVPRGGTYSVKAEICLGPVGSGLGPVGSACTGQDYAEARDFVADTSNVAGVDFVVPVPPNSFTVAPQPVVNGRPVSGETLTATVGAWEPAPDSTSWQWYADGYAIYEATGTTLELTDDQVGKLIQVVVTRARSGYATLTLPSEPMLAEVAGAIHALTPSRLLDSRIGQGFQGPATNGTVITLPVWGKGGVPEGASAVLVNITVTQPTASGFLTAYASGGAAPWVSNANFTAGTTAANLSLVPVGADGAIALKTFVPGSVHVVADVQGYVVGGAVSAAGAVLPVTPTRVLDTRTTQRVGARGTVTLAVAGVAGVPADAVAVVANITVTGPGGPGYLTAWPTGVARPTASNVNFVANQTVPNMAIVKVGDNKSISIFNSSGPVDVVVDIQGYVTAGTATLPGTVVPVTPTRVVDTRLDLGADGPVTPNGGRAVDFSSDDLSALPQGALINLTVTEPQASGWLSAYPNGVERPLVSNLNFTAGMVVPNLSLATLNDGYAILYNGSPGTVQIVADVLAYVL